MHHAPPTAMQNRTPLDIIEDHIRSASLQIERLRMLAEQLEGAGEDTSSAEDLIAAMHEILVDWYVLRAKLLSDDR